VREKSKIGLKEVKPDSTNLSLAQEDPRANIEKCTRHRLGLGAYNHNKSYWCPTQLTWVGHEHQNFKFI